MSQQIVSQVTSPDGLWTTTTFDDGTVIVGPAAGTPLATQQANQQTLLSKAQTALGNNQTYLAIASPTNAQVAAQVKALTRQVDALIRLQLAAFDTISDT